MDEHRYMVRDRRCAVRRERVDMSRHTHARARGCLCVRVYVFVYACLYVCVCVRVCVLVGEEGAQRAAFSNTGRNVEPPVAPMRATNDPGTAAPVTLLRSCFDDFFESSFTSTV